MNRSSDSISAISADLVVALGEMSDVHKGREAKVPTKAGSSYTYRYADLADALSQVRPILAAHGLAIVQNVSSPDPDSVAISTTILHRSGEWITFEALLLPSGRTAQEAGSAITYGRRYSLLAALGLGAEDDDGASASARGGSKASGEARGRSGSRDSRPTAKAAPAAVEARSEEEETIRRLLSTIPAAEATVIKQSFREEFGPLVDLAVDRHADALAWVEEQIVRLEEVLAVREAFPAAEESQ